MKTDTSAIWTYNSVQLPSRIIEIASSKSFASFGSKVKVPFNPGRGDSTQEQTEIKNFKWLEPLHDGFRNYVNQIIL